ncbi:amidohydrolase family protein [Chloroflexota bacterium]
MQYEARFVVDTHAHITTLYQPAGEKSLELARKGLWIGLNGELEPFDNSPLTLYDMGRYGVDMCMLKPSIIGTTNEMHAMLVDRHPDKFRAFCSDQKLKIQVWREEAEWTLDAAVEEVEAALKTGKFVGIGEFVPGGPQVERKKRPTFEERLDEFRHFMELARQYGVTIDLHEGNVGHSWDIGQLYSQLSREYPDVPIIYCHGGGHDDISIKKACAIAGQRSNNVYLETGSWTAEQYMIALDDPNVGVTQLIWGARLR